MASNPLALIELTLTLAVNYVVHSTLLLVTTWLVTNQFRLSPFVAERLWKAAAVLPLVTASLQLGFASENQDATWVIQIDSEPRVTPAAEEAAHRDPMPQRQHTVPARMPQQESPAPEPPVNDTTTTKNETPRPGRSQEGGPARSSSPRPSRSVPRPKVRQRLPDSVPVVALESDSVSRPAHGEEPVATVDSEKEEAVRPALKQPAPTIASPSPVNGLPDIETPVVDTVSPGSGTVQTIHSQEPPLSVATILVLLLGIGVVAGLTRFLMRQLRFWLQMRRVTPLRTGPAYDVLQQLLVDQSLKQPVRLCETDQFDEPIACGIFRWRIVLPPGSESRLERGQLQAMLAHELAHLVRRDTLWLCFGHVLCSTLWFQPLNRLARRRWQQAAEFLCDAWAVRESRINPLTLAQSLTRIAEWRLGERTSVRLLTATGSSSTLTARVTHLVERSKDPDRWQSRWRRRSFLGGLLIAAAVFAILAPRAALTQPIPARATSDAGRTRPERQPVASRSDSASHSESPRAVHTPALNPANQHDNTLQHTTSSTAERPQLLSEWTLLQQELQELNRSLAEVSLLLESRSDDPRLREVARRIRDRTAALEQRRSELQRLLFPPVPLSRHEHDIPVRPAGVPDRVSLSDRPSVLSFREKNS